MEEKITVSATLAAPQNKVWEYYTQPEHITQWNFAAPSWHCPSASNELKIGGRYCARMEAKDGSFGFDFEAFYTELQMGHSFTYEFWGRYATVALQTEGDHTKLTITFDPETENPIDLQRDGWQSILNNFKSYVEAR